MADKLDPLPLAVASFLREQGDAPHCWLVAVSGGPDSTALLHVLAHARQLQQFEVHAAHLNHQLRGKDSDADEAFVCTVCHSLRIPLHVERRDIRILQGKVGNLEATARRLRYDWLHETAHQIIASSTLAIANKILIWIATGHHAGDQAETVLHHILRGTGLRGLRGIAPHRALDSQVALVRPLLKVPRQQILHYLQTQDLSYCHDHSNSDLRLTRNRIRHELLPLLEVRYHLATEQHLLQLAQQAQEWQEYISAQATMLLKQVEKPRVGQQLVLDQPTLNSLPRLMVREILHLLWEREGWPLSGMTQAHWERGTQIASGLLPAGDFPGGVRMMYRGHAVQLTRVT